jgi:hypothetical protein
MHQLTTNKPTNKQPLKQMTNNLFADGRAKCKALFVCQLNQSCVQTHSSNVSSHLININRECVWRIVRSRRDIRNKDCQLPAGEAPTDNYSFGRKSLDGYLEIEFKWAVQAIETDQKSTE